MACSCGPNWSAVADRQPIGKPSLTVRGTAECSIYSKPELKPAASPGINPTELLLELVWHDKPHSGPGSDAIIPHDVVYHHAGDREIEEVVIVNCGNKRIKVEIIV